MREKNKEEKERTEREREKESCYASVSQESPRMKSARSHYLMYVSNHFLRGNNNKKAPCESEGTASRAGPDVSTIKESSPL